jgi:hypothetical protein
MATQDAKPGFLSSMMSGIKGWVKGAIAGGVIGLIAGAVIGGVVALINPVAGAEVFALTTAETASLGAATITVIGTALAGASALGSLGGLAGAMTEVVRSREAAQPSAQDIVGVAKMSFAQGVAVGHNIAQQQQQEQAGPSFVERENQRRAAAAQSQLVH